MNSKKKNFNFSIILTACIKTVSMLPFLERTSVKDRINDYKETFNKWCQNEFTDKIIFIENSGYDLSFFNEKSKEFPNKKIEIISANLNNSYPKELGKGYGDFLCLKEVFSKSKIVSETDFFCKITGRYYVKNFKDIVSDVKKRKSDFNGYINNKFTWCEAGVLFGSKYFFTEYLLPSAANTNDTKKVYFEHCCAKAMLRAIIDDLSFNLITIYPDYDGIIGTNNKKFKNNIFKKIKLFFFGKIKNYFLNHKKY